MYKSVILCALINFGWSSIASEQKSIYLIDLFPAFKSKELCNATERLLKGGIDPNYRPSIGHLSPLMWAMKNNHRKLARILLNHDANPYHVVTVMPEEQYLSITTNLYIAFSTPWRENAFMMGDQKIQRWLNDHIKKMKSRYLKKNNYATR